MKRLIKCAVAFGLLMGAGTVVAQDYTGDASGYGTGDKTDAGEVIENVATVSYSVDGVDQVAEVNDPESEFMVDRVILVNVANQDAGNEVSVVPEAEDRYLTFLVTNDSNATIDLLLGLQQLDDEDFDATDVTVWVENDAAPGFQSSGPTADTRIDNTGMLLEDMEENEDRTVYVMGTIPDSTEVSDGDDASIVLLATAYETDGTTLIEETNVGLTNEDIANDDGVNTGAMVMDTVFGDLAGDYGDDGNPVVDLVDDLDEDGQHSDTGTFVVGSASISVTKTSVVLEDPFNGTTNPKAIPGAEVLYCIVIENSGGTAADNVSVKDPIPTGTTYVDGSIEVFVDDITCDSDLVGDGFAISDADNDAAAEEAASLIALTVEVSGNNGDTGAAEVAGSTVNTTVDTVEDTDGVTATIFRVTID